MEQFLDTSSGIGDVIVMMEETEAVEDEPEPNKQHNNHDGSDAVTKKLMMKSSRTKRALEHLMNLRELFPLKNKPD
jgi:hypothetical protein